jgi:hypothetical protein
MIFNRHRGDAARALKTMVGYIKEIASDLANLPHRPADPVRLLRALAEELNRLDPRDFVPVGQYRFIKLRDRVRALATIHSFTGNQIPAFAEVGCEALHVLDLYAGIGSQGSLRSFGFVTDPGLRDIIERDYKELSLILLPGRAWKSTVVMAGSILEAILTDLLKNPANASRAVSAKRAPKKKNLAAGEWKLHELIEVSVELGFLPSDRAALFDQLLRDYRNFVHPLKEIRAAHPCTEAEAHMSWGALEAVCNDLTP